MILQWLPSLSLYFFLVMLTWIGAGVARSGHVMGVATLLYYLLFRYRTSYNG